MTAITATVIATEAARELVGALYAEHGPISLHVSGSYGVSVVCLTLSELKIGPRDVLMGDVRLSETETVPLYFMTSEVEYWAGSTVVIDVARGVAAGFSLEGPRGVHFTLRKRADPRKRLWDADAILARGAPATYQPRTSTDD
ncbi:DUF779 domain-containing protein [uncultured Hyphomicrobium sp.]|uniref:DUF779 domain-containing protein n=2 Tax=Hyphomicrobium TaxID=81 RepID=UPI0025F2292E|nr:DUF779 domain-containing protein [uncultured Hyphomicrobium sp.]